MRNRQHLSLVSPGEPQHGDAATRSSLAHPELGARTAPSPGGSLVDEVADALLWQLEIAACRLEIHARKLREVMDRDEL